MPDKITRDTLVSASELASVLDVTARNIRQLTEDGSLEKSKPGRYLLCDSVKKYIQLKTTGGDAKLDARKKKADVKLKTAKARRAALEADELLGKMHRSEDVAAMTEDLIYTIRGSLMALPGRLAADTAAAQTPAEAAEAIRRETILLMQELVQYRYDPKKYRERARKRIGWDTDGGGNSDNGSDGDDDDDTDDDDDDDDGDDDEDDDDTDDDDDGGGE